MDVEEGQCVVIGVRLGICTLVASFVGFSTQHSEGLRVSADLTTEVDFELVEQVTRAD